LHRAPDACDRNDAPLKYVVDRNKQQKKHSDQSCEDHEKCRKQHNG
jgi:hypothetical protein